MRRKAAGPSEPARPALRTHGSRPFPPLTGSEERGERPRRRPPGSMEGSNVKPDDGKVETLANLIEVQDGSVVSRTLLKEKGGTVTLFAFDSGQGLSEHSAPFSALVLGIAGEADITVAGTRHRVGGGRMLRLPANVPHAIAAISPFKMLLIMARA